MSTILLYVEDEPDDAYFMRAAFKKLAVAADVRVVEDGLSAIAYLAGQAPFDDRQRHPLPTILLLDLNLPGLSGFEVLQWVRQRPELQTLTVVIFSSSGRPEDRSRARELGATDYLMKPNSGVRFSDVAQHIHRTWLPSSSVGSA